MYRLPGAEYVKARSMREVLEVLSQNPGAKVLAGGTDLVIDLKTGRVKAEKIVDIGELTELRYIVDNPFSLAIGALTTIQQILDSPLVKSKAPLLWEAASQFAYWQIRNRATVGGNLCNASPAADLAPPLLVYEAVVKAVSLKGERFIPIKDFFKGYRQTALGEDEILAEVLIPYRMFQGYGSAYGKIGRRRGHDISVVSAAIAVKIEEGVISDVKVALGSVAPVPIRARSVEDYLRGKQPLVDIIEEAGKIVLNDISPISDVRAPAEYRARIAQVLVRDLLSEAVKKCFRGGFE